MSVNIRSVTTGRGVVVSCIMILYIYYYYHYLCYNNIMNSTQCVGRHEIHAPHKRVQIVMIVLHDCTC